MVLTCKTLRGKHIQAGVSTATIAVWTNLPASRFHYCSESVTNVREWFDGKHPTQYAYDAGNRRRVDRQLHPVQVEASRSAKQLCVAGTCLRPQNVQNVRNVVKELSIRCPDIRIGHNAPGSELALRAEHDT